MPDHNACPEIWRGRAELIDGVAAALNRLYDDPRRSQQLAQAAYGATQNPDYEWDAIAERFDGLFAELG